MKKASAFGTFGMMVFLVCAILNKEGWDTPVLSTLGWIYTNMIDPMCHGIMLVIRHFSA